MSFLAPGPRHFGFSPSPDRAPDTQPEVHAIEPQTLSITGEAALNLLRAAADAASALEACARILVEIGHANTARAAGDLSSALNQAIAAATE